MLRGGILGLVSLFPGVLLGYIVGIPLLLIASALGWW